MQVKELDGVKVTKNETGIYFDDELVLLKDFLVYYLMYALDLENKEQAEKRYDTLTALQLVAIYAVTQKNKE